jgi:DMSO/TMAO reductase YedYZ molybdopterin-dependent catalytic subunit
MMVFRSLGLKRPSAGRDKNGRIPPGQTLTTQWPVLHNGPVPRFDENEWSLSIFGEVAHSFSLSWTDFNALPRVTVNADMHCVTRWSKLDMVWEGVSFRTIAELAQPADNVRHVLFISDGDYTTNVPLEMAMSDDVLFATHANGSALEPDHGFPLRSIVPRRYAWKSAKWLRGVQFLVEDEPGFWESYGYHNNGDYWNEERFG